jgi:hypothetical protein
LGSIAHLTLKPESRKAFGTVSVSILAFVLGRCDLWHTQGVPKRPRDPNQVAKLIVDIATGGAEDAVSESKRHPETRRGRSGGLKGGRSRSVSLTPEQRQEIAKTAAEARWKKRI